ncbi:MAG: MBL fold metallo-hydrolase [Maricaulaceae bacterium]
MTYKSFFLTTALFLSLPQMATAHGDAHQNGNHKESETQAGQARYLANSAVLVTEGETKILFDPLFHNNFGQYQLVPDDVRAAIFASSGPFAGVDAVFISHAHGDHFNAGDANQYLSQNPTVRFVAPQQAIDSMKKQEDWNEAFTSSITAVNLEYGASPVTIQVGDITATAVRIPHAGWPDPRRVSVQNMVYRVSIDGGATVMHMGDADPREQHYTPFADHWQAKQTDTAFPPYWFFLSDGGTDILTQTLNVQDAVGVHVPIKVPQELQDSGAQYFSTLGETRAISIAKDEMDLGQ